MTATGCAAATRVAIAIRPDSALRRCVDLTAAIALLVLGSPVLLIIALAIRTSGRGPMIFRQRRAGRDGEPFTIWKFRTMVVGAERSGPAVTGRDDDRITGIGRRLRATRLDELPQLVNLLRGDMTLIGPRPEVARFLPYYTAAERRVLAVRPGILGPGALLFAATQSDELDTADDPDAHYVACHLHPKLALDLDYLTDRRPGTDLRLLAAAARVLLGQHSAPRTPTSRRGRTRTDGRPPRAL